MAFGLSLQSSGPGALHPRQERPLVTVLAELLARFQRLQEIRGGLIGERMLKVTPECDAGASGAKTRGRRAFQPEEVASAEARGRK